MLNFEMKWSFMRKCHRWNQQIKSRDCFEDKNTYRSMIMENRFTQIAFLVPFSANSSKAMEGKVMIEPPQITGGWQIAFAGWPIWLTSCCSRLPLTIGTLHVSHNKLSHDLNGLSIQFPSVRCRLTQSLIISIIIMC